MSIKVHVLGWREGIGQQVDRIEQGFRTLGCEVVGSDVLPNLLYCNDAGFYKEATFRRGSDTKVIFNVLDLAPHLGSAFPLARIKEQLSHADAVTTISETVQKDIRARLGIEAKVIYNPIRNVKRNQLVDRPNNALFVGRTSDPEKRSAIAASALAILGFGHEEVMTVGREAPFYGGDYAGEVTDEQLSIYYNASSYLMCPTRNAFLGLPILEAMACGCIPVVCKDLDILDEFLPADVFPEYREIEPFAPSIVRFVSRFMQDNDAKAEFSERVYRHYMDNWAVKLSPKGVAQNIIDVYQNL